jgi:DNA repair exonuclease SbcCD ATPase subunit
MVVISYDMKTLCVQDDVRAKRAELREMEQDIATVEERIDAALERNNNLAVFRQASKMAFAKLCEREAEADKLQEERNRIMKLTQDKEAELEAQGRSTGRAPKKDLKKYGAQVRGLTPSRPVADPPTLAS